MPSLTEIHLEVQLDQSLTEFPDLTSLSSLKKLWLHNNAINEVPVELVEGLPALQLLYLRDNQLTLFPDLTNSNIRELYLHQNQLQALPTVYSESGSVITRLEAYTNEITDVSATSLQSMSTLQILKLNYNQITHFPDIRGIESSLRTLEINNNQIEYIDPSFFNFPTSTNGINLKMHNNEITSIPAVSAPNAASVYIKADGNPLHCNITFSWVTSRESSQSIDGDCSTPEELSGRSVDSIQLKEFGLPRKLPYIFLGNLL